MSSDPLFRSYHSAATDSIREMISTFGVDPPDGDFQRGYLQACLDMLEQVYRAETERP